MIQRSHMTPADRSGPNQAGPIVSSNTLTMSQRTQLLNDDAASNALRMIRVSLYE